MVYFVIPLIHNCGSTIETKKLKLSFNSEYPVDYCPKCEVYLYRWGRDDTYGICSKEERNVIKYIEDSQKIIKRKRLENIAESEKVN
jgi:hypothetical protein